MTDLDLPEPRSPEPHDPVRPSALVLPAVAFDPPLDERRPWLERNEFVDALAVPGADSPVYLTETGVAVTTTGLGKREAATTVTSLLTNPGIDLESAYVVSAGIAGASPATAALGSVFVADAILDWDRKHRWGRDGDHSWIDVLTYQPENAVTHLNGELVDAAVAAADGVGLSVDETAREYQRRYPDAGDDAPAVAVGTTVTGDEFWHGAGVARQVEWLCEAYDVAPYATTQMEDAATATALERFGLLERYLSVRAVANYDRPAPDQSVDESFEGVPESLELAVENAANVGSAVVEHLIERDPLGIR
ncbi:purine nucleoside permease [Natronobeatus ordinarius]|uniref:purine nucleoside permease n=1 Tax=Natronobeatus ordinarius TaxID=2963433 RepID=UPI0020CD8F9F|nr:purine nucleoside permease [Natronobeatus ordinarius]